MEIFAPAFGLEAHYEVSNLGNLRRAAPGKGARMGRNFGPPSKGYHTARICIDGRPRTVAVHRLIEASYIKTHRFAYGEIARLADEWGVKKSTLYAVRAGINWRHA